MDQAQFDKLIQDVEGGLTLGQALAKIPTTYNALYRFRDKDPIRRQAIARAKADGAHALADSALTVVDEEENPQRGKARAEIRLKLASYANRQDYGDKIDLRLTDTTNPAALDQEGRQRVRLLRDPAAPLTLQAIEDAVIVDDSATGNRSVAGIPELVRGTIFE